MNGIMRHPVDRQAGIHSFVGSAQAGDISAMRAQVSSGFDLNGRDHSGDTILEHVISALEFSPGMRRDEVVEEMLRLGADPNTLGRDGASPLFCAVVDMDTRLMRILIEAGADPNARLRILRSAQADRHATRPDAIFESLYDWAEFAYRYTVWNARPPEAATLADGKDEDAWLLYLDRLAVKYGRRRPDHLQLLRQRGALSTVELRQCGQRQGGYAALVGTSTKHSVVGKGDLHPRAAASAAADL